MQRNCHACNSVCVDDEGGFDDYEFIMFPENLAFLLFKYCAQCIINIGLLTELESEVINSRYEFMRMSTRVFFIIKTSELRWKGEHPTTKLWLSLTKIGKGFYMMDIDEFRQIVNQNGLLRSYILPPKLAIILGERGFSFTNSSFKKEDYIHNYKMVKLTHAC